MKRGLTLAAVLVALTAGTASAATITQNTNLGTVYTTSAVEEETMGNEMNGMVVTATVAGANGTFEISRVWGSLGPIGGVNFGSIPFLDDFALVVTGDTYDNGNWDLDFELLGNYRLVSLAFDGRPGNTVFDTGFGGSVGTAGSSLGRDFAGFGNWAGNISATYSNAVALGAGAPVGDLYTNFLLSFGTPGLPEGAIGSFLATGYYNFTLDTDNVRGLQQTAVPEPGSMILLGTGLAGLASRLRRKKAA